MKEDVIDGSCIRVLRILYTILVGKLKGREHLEDLGVDGNIILEFILEK
jgi:hypothetical protein